MVVCKASFKGDIGPFRAALGPIPWKICDCEPLGNLMGDP